MSSKNADFLETLKKAMVEQEPVLIRYEDAEGTETSRFVIPFRWEMKHGRLYFHGYCLNRLEDRTFRLDRVRSCTLQSDLFPSDNLVTHTKEGIHDYFRESMQTGAPRKY